MSGVASGEVDASAGGSLLLKSREKKLIAALP
jgi:hypothetical protein